MKTKTKYAPRFSIGGNRVKKGTKYFAVDYYSGNITEGVAEDNENSHSYCYFLNHDEAEIYSSLVISSYAIIRAKSKIEGTNKGK